jgi:succinyl-CoA synthetase beta subunit
MDLFEYQGKELFRRNGVPTTPEGRLCQTPDEVEQAARDLGGTVVVKAQVKTGGRGKAGGVKVATSPEEARAAAEAIFGLDIRGHIVHLIWVEPASDIAAEYYLSVLHDRVGKGYLVICSAEGGMDIEEVNRTRPEAVVKEPLLPSDLRGGLPRERALSIIERARVPESARDEATDLLVRLLDMLINADALLLEVNPLVELTDGRVIALDAKVTLDGNALFRHQEYEEYNKPDASDDEQERLAKEKGIQYVKLEGEVGVLGNGAGLVMATLDVVAQAGGKPADFLDVGGGASAEKMADSLAIVLSDPQVRSVLVNIFGGITRGEEVANGVLAAMDRLGEVEDTIVVRLDGTNAAEGRRILDAAAHPKIAAERTMEDAARRAVELAHQ